MTDPSNNAGDQATATPDERTLLLARARQVNMSHSPNIGTETLKAKLHAFLNNLPDPETVEPHAVTAVAVAGLTHAQSEQKIRQELQKEQLALVRVRVTNMNPAKSQLHGEIITVQNKYLGKVSKFIPYGEAGEAGYHIPKVLLTQLQEQKFNQIKTRPGTDKREVVVEQRMVREFSIEILPPLTDAELATLKASQMARGDGYNTD